MPRAPISATFILLVVVLLSCYYYVWWSKVLPQAKWASPYIALHLIQMPDSVKLSICCVTQRRTRETGGRMMEEWDGGAISTTDVVDQNCWEIDQEQRSQSVECHHLFLNNHPVTLAHYELVSSSAVSVTSENTEQFIHFIEKPHQDKLTGCDLVHVVWRWRCNENRKINTVGG